MVLKVALDCICPFFLGRWHARMRGRLQSVKQQVVIRWIPNVGPMKWSLTDVHFVPEWLSKRRRLALSSWGAAKGGNGHRSGATLAAIASPLAAGFDHRHTLTRPLFVYGALSSITDKRWRASALTSVSRHQRRFPRQFIAVAAVFFWKTSTRRSLYAWKKDVDEKTCNWKIKRE